ncbi:thermonuclease family protein [Megalodesulfovibrio paquesii]
MAARVLLLFLLLLPASAWGWSGVVSRVSDGDTFRVRLDNATVVKVRLYGIDCPEKEQPGGQNATEFTRAKVFGQRVEAETVSVDRYGRLVSLVQSSGENLNRQLVIAGHAWVSTKYCHRALCRQFIVDEAAAKASGRGLWADPNPLPPWEWRKHH